MAGYPVVGVSASCTHDPQGVDIYDEEGNLTHYDLGDTVPLSKLISRRYSWLVNRGYLSEDFSETFDTSSITGDLTISGNLTVSGTTDSSSSTTGAVILSGGMGIAKKLYVGTEIVAGNRVSAGIGFSVRSTLAPSAPVVALAGAGAGNVDNGIHYYFVTYVTASGETNLSPQANVTVVDKTTNGQVTVTIPVSSDTRVTARKIYRNTAGNNSWVEVKLLATVADNTTTTYLDNVADASTSWPPTGASTSYYYKDNTTTQPLRDETGPYNLFHATAMNTAVGRGSLAGVVAGTSVGGANNAFGVSALQYLTTGANNNAFGTGAGSSLTTGTDNVIMGHSAGAGITTGGTNIMIGRNTGYGTATSGNNVFIGYYSGYGPGSTGQNPSANTGVGTSTFQSITSGTYNVALGMQSAYYTTSGHYNVALGTTALLSNVTGVSNTAVGYQAGYYATGNYNLHAGSNAGYGTVSTTTGSYNTFLGGVNAGRAFTTGSYNLALGSYAGYSGTTGTVSGSVVIGTDSSGNGAQVTASNTIVLGTTSHTTRVSGTSEFVGQISLVNGTPTTIKFAKASQWGYSSGYRAIVLGDTAGSPNNVTVSIGYDPVGNANGSFTGDGREVLFRNAVEFVTPNAANNAWLKPLKFDSTGNSTMLGLTLTGDLTVSKASPVLGLSASSGTPSLNIDSPAAAYDSYLNFRTGTSARWSWSKGGTESGTNSGSNLYLYAYSDAGALLSTPLTITRSTGDIVLASTTDSSSSTTGAIKTTGGMGIAKKLYVGTDLNVAGTIESSDVRAISQVMGVF